MKILVTAGPTREMIDQVRFLSNLSSGKTGYALAQTAHERGHEVVLISGPVNISPPEGIRFIAITSAAEMHQAALEVFDQVDAVIMTAAVADYRPATRYDGKMKKAPGPFQLDLVRTQDILADLGRKKTTQILIGFALEVANAELHGKRKLKQKNLDLIVLNGPENFGAENSSFRLIDHQGISAPRTVDKAGLALLLVTKAEEISHQAR